jgi:K+-sensing histidine kinase KdpD
VVAVIAAVVLVLLLVARDLYARRREHELKAEIASLRTQVKATDRLANVGRLVSGLAQDLKSPLQGVIGSAELLAASDPSHGAAPEEVQDIRDNVTRAVGIVRNLLAFTETNALNRRWLDVNDIATRAIEYQRVDRYRDGRVKLEGGLRLPLVYVDGRQLEKVIATILGHSAKHSRPGTQTDVVIVTRRGTPPEERLAIDIDDPALALADDAPEWAGELAACRRVLEMHGGSFEIERHRSGGLRFHLELPVTEQVETDTP